MDEKRREEIGHERDGLTTDVGDRPQGPLGSDARRLPRGREKEQTP
jgi:hypothetical protein